jgi:hypothetical protein
MRQAQAVVLALSGTAQLLLLFVVLPLAVAPVVVWIVARRAPELAPGLRTSELLRDGEPARAELLSWKDKGPSFLDRRPMVAFQLSVQPADQPGAEPFQLTVTQSVPRVLLKDFREGMTVDVRLSPDRSTGAIVLHEG